jgi:hypothetical protein
MSCDLDQDELDILEYLVKGRCLSADHSISLKAIKRNMGEMIDDMRMFWTVLSEKDIWDARKRRSRTITLDLLKRSRP